MLFIVLELFGLASWRLRAANPACSTRPLASPAPAVGQSDRFAGWRTARCGGLRGGSAQLARVVFGRGGKTIFIFGGRTANACIGAIRLPRLPGRLRLLHFGLLDLRQKILVERVFALIW